jgi:hypothetical protein
VEAVIWWMMGNHMTRETVLTRGADTLSIQEWSDRVYLKIKTSLFAVGWTYGVNVVGAVPKIITEWKGKGFE